MTSRLLPPRCAELTRNQIGTPQRRPCESPGGLLPGSITLRLPILSAAALNATLPHLLGQVRTAPAPLDSQEGGVAG